MNAYYPHKKNTARKSMPGSVNPSFIEGHHSTVVLREDQRYNGLNYHNQEFYYGNRPDIDMLSNPRPAVYSPNNQRHNPGFTNKIPLLGDRPSNCGSKFRSMSLDGLSNDVGQNQSFFDTNSFQGHGYCSDTNFRSESPDELPKLFKSPRKRAFENRHNFHSKKPRVQVGGRGRGVKRQHSHGSATSGSDTGDDVLDSLFGPEGIDRFDHRSSKNEQRPRDFKRSRYDDCYENRQKSNNRYSENDYRKGDPRKKGRSSHSDSRRFKDRLDNIKQSYNSSRSPSSESSCNSGSEFSNRNSSKGGKRSPYSQKTLKSDLRKKPDSNRKDRQDSENKKNESRHKHVSQNGDKDHRYNKDKLEMSKKREELDKNKKNTDSEKSSGNKTALCEKSPEKSIENGKFHIKKNLSDSDRSSVKKPFVPGAVIFNSSKEISSPSEKCNDKVESNSDKTTEHPLKESPVPPLNDKTETNGFVEKLVLSENGCSKSSVETDTLSVPKSILNENECPKKEQKSRNLFDLNFLKDNLKSPELKSLKKGIHRPSTECKISDQSLKDLKTQNSNSGINKNLFESIGEVNDGCVESNSVTSSGDKTESTVSRSSDGIISEKCEGKLSEQEKLVTCKQTTEKSSNGTPTKLELQTLSSKEISSKDIKRQVEKTAEKEISKFDSLKAKSESSVCNMDKVEISGLAHAGLKKCSPALKSSIESPKSSSGSKSEAGPAESSGGSKSEAGSPKDSDGSKSETRPRKLSGCLKNVSSSISKCKNGSLKSSASQSQTVASKSSSMSKSENVSSGGSKSKSVSSGGSKCESVSPGGSKSENVASGGSKSESDSSGGSKHEIVSSSGSKSENLSSGGSKSENVSGGSKCESVSSGGSKHEGLSSGGSKFENVSSGRSKSENIPSSGSKLESVSSDGSKCENMSSSGSKCENGLLKTSTVPTFENVSHSETGSSKSANVSKSEVRSSKSSSVLKCETELSKTSRGSKSEKKLSKSSSKSKSEKVSSSVTKDGNGSSKALSVPKSNLGSPKSSSESQSKTGLSNSSRVSQCEIESSRSPSLSSQPETMSSKSSKVIQSETGSSKSSRVSQSISETKLSETSSILQSETGSSRSETKSSKMPSVSQSETGSSRSKTKLSKTSNALQSETGSSKSETKPSETSSVSQSETGSSKSETKSSKMSNVLQSETGSSKSETKSSKMSNVLQSETGSSKSETKSSKMSNVLQSETGSSKSETKSSKMSNVLQSETGSSKSETKSSKMSNVLQSETGSSKLETKSSKMSDVLQSETGSSRSDTKPSKMPSVSPSETGSSRSETKSSKMSNVFKSETGSSKSETKLSETSSVSQLETGSSRSETKSSKTSDVLRSETGSSRSETKSSKTSDVLQSETGSSKSETKSLKPSSLSKCKTLKSNCESRSPKTSIPSRNEKVSSKSDSGSRKSLSENGTELRKSSSVSKSSIESTKHLSKSHSERLKTDNASSRENGTDLPNLSKVSKSSTESTKNLSKSHSELLKTADDLNCNINSAKTDTVRSHLDPTKTIEMSLSETVFTKASCVSDTESGSQMDRSEFNKSPGKTDLSEWSSKFRDASAKSATMHGKITKSSKSPCGDRSGENVVKKSKSKPGSSKSSISHPSSLKSLKSAQKSSHNPSSAFSKTKQKVRNNKATNGKSSSKILSLDKPVKNSSKILSSNDEVHKKCFKSPQLSLILDTETSQLLLNKSPNVSPHKLSTVIKEKLDNKRKRHSSDESTNKLKDTLEPRSTRMRHKSEKSTGSFVIENDKLSSYNFCTSGKTLKLPLSLGNSNIGVTSFRDGSKSNDTVSGSNLIYNNSYTTHHATTSDEMTAKSNTNDTTTESPGALPVKTFSSNNLSSVSSPKNLGSELLPGDAVNSKSESVENVCRTDNESTFVNDKTRPYKVIYQPGISDISSGEEDTDIEIAIPSKTNGLLERTLKNNHELYSSRLKAHPEQNEQNANSDIDEVKPYESGGSTPLQDERSDSELNECLFPNKKSGDMRLKVLIKKEPVDNTDVSNINKIKQTIKEEPMDVEYKASQVIKVEKDSCHDHGFESREKKAKAEDINKTTDKLSTNKDNVVSNNEAPNSVEAHVENESMDNNNGEPASDGKEDKEIAEDEEIAGNLVIDFDRPPSADLSQTNTHISSDQNHVDNPEPLRSETPRPATPTLFNLNDILESKRSECVSSAVSIPEISTICSDEHEQGIHPTSDAPDKESNESITTESLSRVNSAVVKGNENSDGDLEKSVTESEGRGNRSLDETIRYCQTSENEESMIDPLSEVNEDVNKSDVDMASDSNADMNKLNTNSEDKDSVGVDLGENKTVVEPSCDDSFTSIDGLSQDDIDDDNDVRIMVYIKGVPQSPWTPAPAKYECSDNEMEDLENDHKRTALPDLESDAGKCTPNSEGSYIPSSLPGSPSLDDNFEGLCSVGTGLDMQSISSFDDTVNNVAEIKKGNAEKCAESMKDGTSGLTTPFYATPLDIRNSSIEAQIQNMEMMLKSLSDSLAESSNPMSKAMYDSLSSFSQNFSGLKSVQRNCENVDNDGSSQASNSKSSETNIASEVICVNTESNSVLKDVSNLEVNSDTRSGMETFKTIEIGRETENTVKNTHEKSVANKCVSFASGNVEELHIEPSFQKGLSSASDLSKSMTSSAERNINSVSVMNTRQMAAMAADTGLCYTTNHESAQNMSNPMQAMTVEQDNQRKQKNYFTNQRSITEARIGTAASLSDSCSNSSVNTSSSGNPLHRHERSHSGLRTFVSPDMHSEYHQAAVQLNAISGTLPNYAKNSSCPNHTHAAPNQMNASATFSNAPHQVRRSLDSMQQDLVMNQWTMTKNSPVGTTNTMYASPADMNIRFTHTKTVAVLDLIKTHNTIGMLLPMLFSDELHRCVQCYTCKNFFSPLQFKMHLDGKLSNSVHLDSLLADFIPTRKLSNQEKVEWDKFTEIYNKEHSKRSHGREQRPRTSRQDHNQYTKNHRLGNTAATIHNGHNGRHTISHPQALEQAAQQALYHFNQNPVPQCCPSSLQKSQVNARTFEPQNHMSDSRTSDNRNPHFILNPHQREHLNHLPQNGPSRLTGTKKLPSNMARNHTYNMTGNQHIPSNISGTQNISSTQPRTTSLGGNCSPVTSVHGSQQQVANLQTNRNSPITPESRQLEMCQQSIPRLQAQHPPSGVEMCQQSIPRLQAQHPPSGVEMCQQSIPRLQAQHPPSCVENSQISPSQTVSASPSSISEQPVHGSPENFSCQSAQAISPHSPTSPRCHNTSGHQEKRSSGTATSHHCIFKRGSSGGIHLDIQKPSDIIKAFRISQNIQMDCLASMASYMEQQEQTVKRLEKDLQVANLKNKESEDNLERFGKKISELFNQYHGSDKDS